jgi:hypothetical protein
VATTYYVRPDGSDSNSGLGPSTSEAWQTIGKAWSNANTGGDVVWIAPGVYSPPTTAKDHGSATNPVQYIGDPTGTIFGVSPGIVRINGPIPAVGGTTTRYILLKNMFISYIGNGTSWQKHINTVLYGTRSGYSIDLAGGKVYVYNSSLKGGLDMANSTDEIHLYNCAAEGSLTVSKGILELKYCIAPAGSGTGFIAADPQFSDTATYDYTLRPGSLAIDSGYDYGLAINDVYGFSRVHGAQIDRGAAESLQLGTVTWVYPAADGSAFFIDHPWVVFTAPTPTYGSPNLQFKVTCFADSVGTDVIMARESYYNPEHFRVWNGSAWAEFPASGLGLEYYGAQVACYMNVPRRDAYYFRAWAGVVV